MMTRTGFLTLIAGALVAPFLRKNRLDIPQSDISRFVFPVKLPYTIYSTSGWTEEYDENHRLIKKTYNPKQDVSKWI